MRYFILVVSFLAIAGVVRAEAGVNYNNEVIVDSDLDGLTDKGEQQLYQTNPGNQDTDSDGYLDGAEVLAGTNPLEAADYPGHRSADLLEKEDILASVGVPAPWTWYVVRAAGLIAFIFLWLAVFLGLSIRNPLLKKIIGPLYSFEFHCFVAAISVFWALIHGTSLLFDKTIGFSIKDVAIPYFSQTTIVDPNFLALGIMAFYAMVIMTITSYLRNHLNHWLWRILHFLNPVAFIFVVFHGYYNGTDMKDIRVAAVYLFASLFLVIIYLTTLGAIIWGKVKAKATVQENTLA